MSVLLFRHFVTPVCLGATGHVPIAADGALIHHEIDVHILKHVKVGGVTRLFFRIITILPLARKMERIFLMSTGSSRFWHILS